MLISTSAPKTAAKVQPHVFVTPTVREIRRPTEPASAAATW
jgi:hypothetical protein